jgi:serine/threonine-protein kinase
VTGQSDVYALGIVLYEMLTGRRPFEGDSAAGVALKRLSEDPQPPTVHGPVPPALSAIVMRALERDPEKRYPDAGAFAEALRVWQSDPDAAAAIAAGTAAAAGAAVAAAAATPAAGEPTVYVPPRVTLPSDRAAISGMPPGAGDPPRRPPARYAQPRREEQPWWMWLLAVLAVILLGTIGFLGAQVIGGLGPDSSPTPTPTGLTVPDWVGDPIASVRADAIRLGIVLDEQPPEPSDTVAVDRVIRISPEANTSIEPGGHVQVVVSSGKEQVPVPRLIGQTKDEATATLHSVGLELGLVSSEPSDRTAGEVMSTNPSAGVKVGKGSQVDLVLSSGPTPSPTPSPTPVPTPPPTPEPPTPSPSILPIGP